MSLFDKIFGTYSDRELKRIYPIADKVMALEPEIEKLDLFNVSEIKRPKGGGLEIKFFDRLKALERLDKISGGEEHSQSSFIQALSEGAKNLSQGDSD